MACREIERWSWCSLVCAYLDLALAYLFLCAAAVAFLCSRFLALFGLALPCPCHGLFGCHLPNPACLQAFLVDFPTTKIAGVHAAVQSYDIRFVSGDAGERGLLEEGRVAEESCGSVSDARVSKNLSLPGPVPTDGPPPDSAANSPKRGFPDAKGKGVIIRQRPTPTPPPPPLPPGLRRRRRRWRPSLSVRGKSPPAFSVTPLQLGWKAEASLQTPFGVFGQTQKGAPDGSSAAMDSGVLVDGCGGLADEIALATECDSVVKEASVAAKDVLESKENEAINKIQDLEKALEEEQKAHAALYLELEKERTAAATAADEAMAMILRLQEEKAAVKMEARQYHSMIEEKSAYDEEEMEILKEIIVRREREKYVLEREVEEYRQMLESGRLVERPLSSNLDDVEQLVGQKPVSPLNLFDDPEALLKQICETIEKKEKTKAEMHSEPSTAERQSNSTVSGKASISSCLAEDADHSNYVDVEQTLRIKNQDNNHASNMEFQEKGMVTTEVHPSSVQNERFDNGQDSTLCKVNGSQDHGFHEVTAYLIDEKHGAREREYEMRIPSDGMHRESGQNADQGNLDSSRSEAEANVLDVHVIDNRIKLDDEGNGERTAIFQTGCAWRISGTDGMPNESSRTNSGDHSVNNSDKSWNTTELSIHRSCSEMIEGGQLIGTFCDKVSGFDLRRRSMSAVDIERFKLENEVGRLRERLKIIQRGRKKLSLSVEQREKETSELQLLEDIAYQLKRFGRATECVQQVSLPPSSSMIKAKKRRSSSTSGGAHDSS